MKRTNNPDATRAKILGAAFQEFYRHGFQGGSLNRIVKEAGTTKGSVFHHFEGKNALGYAVVDELLGYKRKMVPALAGLERSG
jgi:TetR/AcrR family transcriptional regulator, transcriptional repressor for nem operon